MDSGSLSLSDWSWEPTVVGGMVALMGAYVWANRRGWIDRGDDVSPWLPSAPWRPALFGLGVASAWIALLSPIDRGGDEYLFSIHMVQHLLLMLVAPPLLLLGICGVRPAPSERAPRLRAGWRRLTRPWAATLLFNAVLLVWHIPTLYDLTLDTQWIHVVEHLSFIGAGIVLFWPIVDPIRGAGTQPVTPLTKVAMLTVAGVPPTGLGFVFALAPTAFYTFYVHAPRLWGISAVDDQHAAGVVMLGLGNLLYFVPISIIFLRIFGNPADDEAQAAAGGVDVARGEAGGC